MKRSDFWMLVGAVYLAPHLWPGIGLGMWVLCLIWACMAATKE